MRRSHWLGLASVAILLLPALAYAQEADDVRRLPKNIGELLDSRRDKTKMPINEDMLKKIAEKMKGIDPKLLDKKTIENLLRNNDTLQDPETMKRLREFVKQHMNDRPIPELDYKNLDNVLKQVQEMSKKAGIDPMHPMNLDPPPGQINPSALDDNLSNPAQRSQASKNEMAENIARMLIRNFGDSPAFQEAAQDIADLLTQETANGDLPKFAEDLQSELKSLMGSSNSDSTSSNWADLFSNMKMPDLSSSSSRSSEHGNAGTVDSSSSSRSSSSGDSGFDGWFELFLIAVLVSGSLLCGYFYFRANSPSSHNNLSVAAVPTFDPSTVATREDVVKAFDAISLAKCGAEAINWHHRQIADNLGGLEPVNRDAVNCAASLYEKARYAPSHEPFSEIEVAEARARLCQIAGVPSK